MRKKSLLAITVVLLLAVGVAAMSFTSAAAPSASRATRLGQALGQQRRGGHRHR
jgi:hypothetical protein